MRAAFADAPSVPGPSIAELQAAFPQLEILELIGRGGMGIVYKARQPHLDRFVALKILAPGFEKDPGFAERFTREARTLAKLTHPNLVAVHDFGESGGFYYLVMEYVDGVNLRQAMHAARFTPEQALGIVPDLCAALQFAHDHGVLHRDIKPENILLDTKGRVKIADFGIAKLIDGEARDFTLTHTGAALGSAAYMAPEQIEHPEDVDHRADIYSLGVVFYEMLTGGLPLGRFPAPSEKSTSDPRLDEVVFRALEKERDKRYQSATDVKTGVAAACKAESTSSRPPPSVKGVKFHTQIPAWPFGTNAYFVTIWLFLGGLVAGVVGLLTSPFLLGLGITSIALGTVLCWWLLLQKEAASLSRPRRELLLALGFWPVLVGLCWLGVFLGIKTFGGWSAKVQLWTWKWLWLVYLLPLSLFSLGFLLPMVIFGKVRAWTQSGPPGRKRGSASAVAFVLLLGVLTAHAGAMLLAYFAGYGVSRYVITKGHGDSALNDEDRAEIQKAYDQTILGLPAEYRVSLQHRELAVNLPNSNSKYPFCSILSLESEAGSQQDLQFQHNAVRARFQGMLPSRFEILTLPTQPSENQERSQLLLWLSGGLFLTGAFLTLPLARGGAVKLVVCGIILTLGIPLLKIRWHRLVGFPEGLETPVLLPQLPMLSGADYDYSTPLATIRSVLKAAEKGDTESFRHGFGPQQLAEFDKSGTGSAARFDFYKNINSPVTGWVRDGHARVVTKWLNGYTVYFDLVAEGREWKVIREDPAGSE